ncbi:MAG: leucine-rich repeat protein [Porcipelethomonas sp.]
MKITKKILGAVTSFACAVSVCVPVMSMQGSAETLGDLTYKSYADHVEITGCDLSATTVTIPSEILNLPVTSINNGAFEDCSSLASVIIPETVTNIGYNAFNGCTSLASAAIPESVTNIGADAFSGTALLSGQSGPVYYVSNWAVASDSATAVEIKANTVGIADSAFYSCGLQTLTIPSSVKYIGNYSFAHNTDLRTVNIPGSVETIGSSAFYGDTYLMSLSIGQKVKSIGANAFANCANIESIKIPDSVKSVGVDAFYGTPEYKKQTGPVIYISSWVVDCLDSTTNISVNIPSGTKGIADGAFSGKGFVTSVTIPSTVKTIGNSAFYDCTALTDATIPEGVETIGSYAFAYTLVASVVIPESTTSIGQSAFSSCKNLQSFKILNSSCSIYDSSDTISSSSNLTLYVYQYSTGESYAQKYGKTFAYITTTDPNPSVKLGDVTGDGNIDVFDAIAVAQYTVGKKTFTSAQLAAADYNKSGGVDVFDAIAIAKYTVS